MAKHKLIPIPQVFAKLKSVEYNPANTPIKPEPRYTTSKIEYRPIPPAGSRRSFTELKPIPSKAISPVSAPVQPPITTPANSGRSVYCFMYDRTRRTISLANAYQSTCTPKQRLSYPHLYIHADSFEHATNKVQQINQELKPIIWKHEADYWQHEQLEAILHQFNGYIHTDEIDKEGVAGLPPQKNITALRRKRSKKSAKGSSQLNALINHEEAKQRSPHTPTELERCKREHRPIKYVAPAPISTIGPHDANRTINRLAVELAAAAVSELGLPPVPTEIEHLEQLEEKQRKAELKRWIKEHPTRSKPFASKATKQAEARAAAVKQQQPKAPKIKSKKANRIAYLYPPVVNGGKWKFAKIVTGKEKE